MQIKEKDRQKVEEAHGIIMDMADKYNMSMEDMIEACCGEGEDEEEGSEYESEGEGEKPPVDKTKIAFIIGKMRGHKGGE